MRGFSVSRSPSPTPGRSGSLGPPSARFSESPGRDTARDALLDVEKISFNGVSQIGTKPEKEIEGVGH